uniref:C-type lectin domain-containing protein n=1 Tax=Cyprinodon variegatus TaxID=28743 RepID=A0A3Q2CTJ8_CYPVA
MEKIIFCFLILTSFCCWGEIYVFVDSPQRSWRYERKTWEDALEHCRKNDGDLISLLSEVENHIAHSRIHHSALTQQVWIGMRYLGDSWMWVNGDPVLYTASTTKGDQDYQCPRLRRCGALTKEGKIKSLIGYIHNI